MELEDLMPEGGKRRTLYCDGCCGSMDLTFSTFQETISGVSIQISNLPYLECPTCGNRYLTERSISAIVETHRQAIDKGSSTVQFKRRTLPPSYKFTEVPFLVDADDYHYFPGLFRPFDEGFLTPLFFKKTVLSKFENLPGYSVRFASQTYGTVDFGDSYFSFGFNRYGKVVMWLGDVARLPEDEQFYLRSENVASDHSIGSEFYDGQISCIFSDPTAESVALKSRSNLAETFEKLYFEKLYHLDDELVETIEKLTPPIIDTDKERGHFFDSLNRIFVESLNNNGLKKVGHSLSTTPASTGSLKRLQAILETRDSSGAVAAALSPFFVIYDLRVAHTHLTSDQRRQTLIDTSTARLGLKNDADLGEIYSELIQRVATSLGTLNSLLVASL